MKKELKFNIVSGSCLAFYSKEAEECKKCSASKKCKKITENENLSCEIKKIKKDEYRKIKKILEDI